MKVFLAAVESVYEENVPLLRGGYNLITFYNMNPRGVHIAKNSKLFLLDSGAFTFLSNSDKAVDWDDYIKRYAEFIIENDIRLYFELDIDVIIGYQRVIELREKLEEITGIKSIPVWHRNRGMDEYKALCEAYDYIAIGGIAIKEIVRNEHRHFLPLIKYAHKCGTRVHGLGFTVTKDLKMYHFDSVDSSSWSSGRWGHRWEFTENNTMKEYEKPAGRRVEDRVGIQAHNIREWVKFQKYADANL